MRFGHVWFGMAGKVGPGSARRCMARFGIAGMVAQGLLRPVAKRRGMEWQAIKGGIIYGLQIKRWCTVENRCPNSR